MCPQYIEDIKNGKIAPKPFIRHSCYHCHPGNLPQDQPQQEKQLQKQHDGKSPKFKAFLSAMSYFMADSKSEDKNKGTNKGNKTEIFDDNNNANDATLAFFASLRLSK
jgi:hypothetical protein